MLMGRSWSGIKGKPMGEDGMTNNPNDTGNLEGMSGGVLFATFKVSLVDIVLEISKRDKAHKSLDEEILRRLNREQKLREAIEGAYHSEACDTWFNNDCNCFKSILRLESK